MHSKLMKNLSDLANSGFCYESEEFKQPVEKMGQFSRYIFSIIVRPTFHVRRIELVSKTAGSAKISGF